MTRSSAPGMAATAARSEASGRNRSRVPPTTSVGTVSSPRRGQASCRPIARMVRMYSRQSRSANSRAMASERVQVAAWGPPRPAGGGARGAPARRREEADRGPERPGAGLHDPGDGRDEDAAEWAGPDAGQRVTRRARHQHQTRHPLRLGQRRLDGHLDTHAPGDDERRLAAGPAEHGEEIFGVVGDGDGVGHAAAGRTGRGPGSRRSPPDARARSRRGTAPRPAASHRDRWRAPRAAPRPAPARRGRCRHDRGCASSRTAGSMTLSM